MKGDLSYPTASCLTNEVFQTPFSSRSLIVNLFSSQDLYRWGGRHEKDGLMPGMPKEQETKEAKHTAPGIR